MRAVIVLLILAAAGVCEVPAASAAPSAAGRSPGSSSALIRPLWTATAPAGGQVGGVAVVGTTVLRTGTAYPAEGVADAEIRRYAAADGADRGPLVRVPGRRFASITRSGEMLIVAAARGDDGAPLLDGYTMGGTLRWERPGGDRVAVGAGVVVAAGGGRLRAYRADTGLALWDEALPGEPSASPVFADGLVLVAAGSMLSAYRADGGAVLWRQPASAAELAVADGSVYTAGDGGTCAFISATGRSRWCSGGPAAHLTVTGDGGNAGNTGDTVFSVGEGVVTGYDAVNGAVRWRQSYARAGFDSTSYWTPVAGSGVLYVVVYHFRPGVQRHELLALAGANGRVLRRLDVPMPFEVGGEPLVGAGHRLYFATLAALQAYALGRPL
jgi:outer membrane protein assembly factor BamB